MQERPITAEALLTGEGTTNRMQALAALTDSLDFLADAIQAAAARGYNPLTAGIENKLEPTSSSHNQADPMNTVMPGIMSG